MKKGVTRITETDLKSQTRDYLRYKGISVYHNLQGIGCYKGLPDMGMHYRGRVHYLEIKLPNGKMSEWQLAFQEQCKSDSIPYHIIRSLEDLQTVLELAQDAPQHDSSPVKDEGNTKHRVKRDYAKRRG